MGKMAAKRVTRWLLVLWKRVDRRRRKRSRGKQVYSYMTSQEVIYLSDLRTAIQCIPLSDCVRHTTPIGTKELLNIPLDIRSLVKAIVDAQGRVRGGQSLWYFSKYHPGLQQLSIQTFSVAYTCMFCAFNDLPYFPLHIHTQWAEWKPWVFWEGPWFFRCKVI